MAERGRKFMSKLVTTEPWRSVGIEFPPTEPTVMEAAKVAQATATGMPFETSARTSDQPVAVVIARSPAK